MKLKASAWFNQLIKDKEKNGNSKARYKKIAQNASQSDKAFSCIDKEKQIFFERLKVTSSWCGSVN